MPGACAWGGVIVAINPNPPPEISKWIEEAQKRSESDEKCLQALVKHKVVSYVLQPEDPVPSPQSVERRKFEEFCRGASSDCGPYAERLIELCALGAVALASQDEGRGKDFALSVLKHLSRRLAPMLEQLVTVEHNLEVLGWGAMALSARAPAEEIKFLQDKFQLKAQELGSLPRSWIYEKLPSTIIAVNHLRELLNDVRGWYERDCRMFEDAARDVGPVPQEQMQWLENIKTRAKTRVSHVDGVLRTLDRQICPCLNRLSQALEISISKRPSSVPA